MNQDRKETELQERLFLVFDWGDTLMKVFPDQPGLMADWPEVAEVDGIVEALEKLLGRHTLAVATNAVDSNAGQVWKAIRRVGLGEYFKAVFTAREIGHKKPEVGFFRQIERVLGGTTQQMVMVGDQYAVDVLGAKTAGWKAVWYNPANRPAPGALPLHDGEIAHMRDLPGAVQEPGAALLPGLPDVATCLAWLEEGGAPFNLLAHVQLVASAAYLLATWMRQSGAGVNPVLTHRGGLLHDLAKMDSLKRRDEPGTRPPDHAAVARDQLLQRGQPALAEIAHRHMPFQDPLDPRRPETWEQKLVHFADKLAEGSRLVTPEERMAALKIRYPRSAQELEASTPLLLELQDDICTFLGTSPTEVIGSLRAALGV
jgi:putative hydrolase of the HAD superfamily